MNSMSRYPAFTQPGRTGATARVAGDLSVSRRITGSAVKFFVPAEPADLTANTGLTVVTDAVTKVAAGLPGRQ